jgi:hypothetical protein
MHSKMAPVRALHQRGLGESAGCVTPMGNLLTQPLANVSPAAPVTLARVCRASWPQPFQSEGAVLCFTLDNSNILRTTVSNRATIHFLGNSAICPKGRSLTLHCGQSRSPCVINHQRGDRPG